MNIYIMAGGPEKYLPEIAEYKDGKGIWVGVDRGVLYLLNRNIAVDAAFGDFDSVTEEEWKEVLAYSGSIQRFKPEKDETDTELAIQWAIEQGANSIKIFGATGGRMDHTIANMQLLLKEVIQNRDIHMEIIDRQNSISIVTEGIYTIKKKEGFPYVSFFPYSTDINGLTLEGFKYPLIDRNIPVSSTLCISNELISEYGTFSFTKGILMVVRSRD